MALRSVLLLVRNAQRTLSFFSEGLGMPIRYTAAEGTVGEVDSGPVGIIVQEVPMGTSEAQLSVGYSPFLNLNVADLDTLLPRLVQMGAHMDGAVRYTPSGKVVALRVPDGFMIGLHEPNAPSASHTQ